MNRNFSLKFKLLDIIIIVCAVIASAGFTIGVILFNKPSSSANSRYVRVYHDDVLIEKYTTRLDTLTEEKKIVLTKEEYPDLLADFTILMDKKKGIRVVDIKCPDHTCENQKWVNMDNLPIICIPNKVRVIIVSEQTYEGDEIIGWRDLYEYHI